MLVVCKQSNEISLTDIGYCFAPQQVRLTESLAARWITCGGWMLGVYPM